MARKKRGQDDMTTAAPTKTPYKPVRVDLDPDVHTLLRLVAAKRGMSMAALAKEVVSGFARAEAKREGFRA